MGAPNKGKGKPKTSRGSQGPDPEWQDPFFDGPSRSGNVPWEGDHDYKTDVSHGGSGTDRDRRNTHTQDNTDDPSFQSGQHDADDPFASRGILNTSGDSVLYNAGEPAVGPEDHYTILPIQQSSAYAGGYGVDQHGHDPESSSSFVPEQSEQSGQQYDGHSDLDQVQAQFSGMSMNQGYYATRPFDHVDSTSTGGYDHTREDVQQSEDPAYLEQTHGGFNQEASGSGYDPEQPQTRKKGPIFLKLFNERKKKPKILEGRVDRHVLYPVIEKAQVADLGLSGKMTSLKSISLATSCGNVNAVGEIELEWEEVDRKDYNMVLSSGVDYFYVIKRPEHRIHVPLTFGLPAATT